MSGMSELQRLARTVGGEPRAALSRLLVLVCEQLGTDLAVVSTAGTVRLAVRADGTPLSPGELSEHTVRTWSRRVAAAGSLLVRDAAATGSGSGSCAGVALRREDGMPAGTLCAVGHAPHPTLNERDVALLYDIGEVVVPLLAALDRSSVPAPRTPAELAPLADALRAARDVEGLSRPLLEALHQLTGLASAYLTAVHEDEDEQEIRYAVNAGEGFAIPEGLRVPWGDTLCKRALDEGRACTTDVPAVWGDSQAAAELGIEVYVSVPVRLSDGRVWGTLCAADAQQHAHVDAHLPTMELFARLIAGGVEREEAIGLARREADTDPLTGCASRRVVTAWLARALHGLPGDHVVAVVYADVDRFKQLNDGHGHAAGDAALVEVGRRLQAVMRPDDLVARLGGDEFLVGARLPRAVAETLEARVRAAGAFVLAVPTGEVAVRLSIGVALADGGDPDELVARADSAMYADKQFRRTGAAVRA